jgi:hypothetical protein
MLHDVEADHVCGRARKMAIGDELRWLERVNEWRTRCEELEEECIIVPEGLVNKIKLQLGNRRNYLLTCSGNYVGIIR